MAQVPASERNAVGAIAAGQSARWYYDAATVHIITDRRAG